MACRCFELFWCATCGCKTILWNASCVDGGFWGLWAVMTFWQMWLSLVPGSERGGRSRKRLNNHRIGAALQHSRVTEATMPQKGVSCWNSCDSAVCFFRPSCQVVVLGMALISCCALLKDVQSGADSWQGMMAKSRWRLITRRPLEWKPMLDSCPKLSKNFAVDHSF